MIQKKICMLGSNAVGKTSLVARFVRSIYSEVYFATVGVKVDKKLVLVNGRKATSFPPFLYAMVLTGGHTDHPAFATLPAANPSAQLP